MPRFKRVIYYIAQTAAAVALMSLCTHIYMKTLILGFKAELLQDIGKTTPLSDDDSSDISSSPSLVPTLSDIIHNDTRLSRFEGLLPFLDQQLSSLDEQYTIFAPIDDAFLQETFEWDLPDFYWMFLAQYHLVRGSLSQKDLLTKETIATHIWADIYYSFPQRMSSQMTPMGTMRFNDRSSIIEGDIKARNGYLHYVDRVLMLPGSTTDVLRQRPEFSTLRKGLIETGLAVTINDTSRHKGQTFFAPSNTAFQKLGPAVNNFLFSPWGNRCLQALLEYHVVANQTLFTNTYFRPNGRGPGQFHDISPGFETDLPTMIPPLHVKTTISEDGARGTIRINDAVEVTQADIVVQDGVVHRIDDILLPPKPGSDSENDPDSESMWGRIQAGVFGPRKMTVEELMERLEPYQRANS